MLNELIEEIERDLPGYQWLIRSDEDGEFFANIMTPDFENIGDEYGEHVGGGECFSRWDETPEKALAGALKAARAKPRPKLVVVS